jgi:FG-GAP-like repeat
MNRPNSRPSHSKFKRFLSGGILLVTIHSSSLFTVADEPAKQSAKKWIVKPLTLDGNEGIAIGDVDGNGSPDIVSGRNWYAAPDFVPRPLRLIEDWNGYVQSNADFLFDVNQDGRLDVVTGSFIPTEVAWYENPGPEGLRLGHTWKRHVLVDTKRTENEAELFQDIDGDKIPDWIVNSWNRANPTMVWRLKPTENAALAPAKFELVGATIAEKGNRHGMGVGDLNGDGRQDILIGSGWYEHPEKDPWTTQWKFHADWDLDASIPMLVYDVDGDGRNDVLVGQGHDYGLYWWKQTAPKDGKLTFDIRLVDKSYSQPHALALADLTGDGRPELISGKRYYAHNGGDPGGQDMPLACYYEFDAKSSEFKKTIIEEGHVGIGLQIACADLDQDGDIDIAVPGKSGTHILFNPSK